MPSYILTVSVPDVYRYRHTDRLDLQSLMQQYVNTKLCENHYPAHTVHVYLAPSPKTRGCQRCVRNDGFPVDMKVLSVIYTAAQAFIDKQNFPPLTKKKKP